MFLFARRHEDGFSQVAHALACNGIILAVWELAHKCLIMIQLFLVILEMPICTGCQLVGNYIIVWFLCAGFAQGFVGFLCIATATVDGCQL